MATPPPCPGHPPSSASWGGGLRAHMSSRRQPDVGAEGGHSGQQRPGARRCQGRRVGGPALSGLRRGGEAAGPGRREARRGNRGGAQEGGHAQLLLLPCALLPSRKCRGLSPRDAGQASPRFWEPPPRRLGEQECALAPAQACLAPQRPTGGPTHPPRPGTACFLEEVALGLACGQTRGRPEARIHWGPALGLGGGAGAG